MISYSLGAFGTPTLPVLAKDPWNKPGPPNSLKVSEITKRSCTVKWQEPSNDGGDPIRHYVVEYKVAGTFKWVCANTGDRTMDRSYKVTGLHTDLDYEFRVAAENKAGVGAFSEVTLPVRAVDPVGKVLNDNLLKSLLHIIDNMLYIITDM